MNLTVDLHNVREHDRDRVGGKFYALAKMTTGGLTVPPAICVSTQAYREYIRSTGLAESIRLELSRKNFEDMRWEEVWDAALRIRSMFANAPLPTALAVPVREALADRFQDKAVVVRSSAPAEDSAQSSFAGLHESYVNVVGIDSIVEHIRKVWASLWSDAALLYRRELSLDIETSSMAVIVQEIVVGQCSGVVFGQSPQDDSQVIIESVYGLNQGLVDGTIEPDRWILERTTGNLIEHMAPERKKTFIPGNEGLQLAPLDRGSTELPPLSQEQVMKVYHLVMEAERLFGGPQDAEWTFRDDELFILQSRPITTIKETDDGDQRPWHLSLRRSFENLKTLRSRIEDELIPQMIAEGSRLAQQDVARLSTRALSEEIERRKDIYDHWVKIYWRDFIPFAHGMRLFAQVYNDAIHPSDPYEFMELLGCPQMLSVERNRRLEQLAAMIRKDPQLAAQLQNEPDPPDGGRFSVELDDFLQSFGDLAWGQVRNLQDRKTLIQMLLQLASRPPAKKPAGKKDPALLEQGFLGQFEGKRQAEAQEFLDLGRASYRLRDDDNIHLGKIEGQMLLAINEGKERLRTLPTGNGDRDRLHQSLQKAATARASAKASSADRGSEAGFSTKPRQLLGQPAGPGMSRGQARVVVESSDLSRFRAGEILVCDAIDPNMTFLVPISNGIVERRGGMLIHGAIIAREYGLPCVTGVPDATGLIQTGDFITVDGYLGIVVIG